MGWLHVVLRFPTTGLKLQMYTRQNQIQGYKLSEFTMKGKKSKCEIQNKNPNPNIADMNILNEIEFH